MKIDTKALEVELKAMIGELVERPKQDSNLPVMPQAKVKVKTDNNSMAKVSVLENDEGYIIGLNPHKIHTPKQLEQVRQYCQKIICWA